MGGNPAGIGELGVRPFMYASHKYHATAGKVLVARLASTSCATQSLQLATLTVRQLMPPSVTIKITECIRLDFEKLGNPGWNWKNFEKYAARAEG